LTTDKKVFLVHSISLLCCEIGMDPTTPRRSVQLIAIQNSLEDDINSILLFRKVGLAMVIIGSTMVGIGLGLGDEGSAIWRLGLAALLLGIGLTMTSFWALRRHKRAIVAEQQAVSRMFSSPETVPVNQPFHVIIIKVFHKFTIILIVFCSFQQMAGNGISIIYGTEGIWAKQTPAAGCSYDAPPSYEECVSSSSSSALPPPKNYNTMAMNSVSHV
jgi:hypothetical protein